jgi:hypothetical protein
MRPSLRASALLAAGTLAVHELRYLIGYGDPAAVGGHGYLTLAAPLVAILLAVSCGVWLARIGRVTGAPARTLTWLGASATLLCAYAVQEIVEGLASTGHPGLLGHGGWIAAPIALAVGAVVTLMLRGVRAADRAAARVARPWSPLGIVPAAPLAFRLPCAPAGGPRPRVLARRLAGRAPPSAF